MFTFTATPTMPLRITFAAASAGRAVVRFVTTAYQRRHNRIMLRELLTWDDHMLADIGIMRADIHCALASGARLEPTRRLQVMAVERRATAMSDARRRVDTVHVDAVSLARAGMRRNRDTEEA